MKTFKVQQREAQPDDLEPEEFELEITDGEGAVLRKESFKAHPWRISELAILQLGSGRHAVSAGATGFLKLFEQALDDGDYERFQAVCDDPIAGFDAEAIAMVADWLLEEENWPPYVAVIALLTFAQANWPHIDAQLLRARLDPYEVSPVRLLNLIEATWLELLWTDDERKVVVDLLSQEEETEERRADAQDASARATARALGLDPEALARQAQAMAENAARRQAEGGAVG